MIVIDASAILEVLLNTPKAAPIARRIFAPGEALHAPHLLDLEVTQVLRRYHLNGELEAERGAEAIEDLADLPLMRYGHELLLPRIWSLRQNATAYDAAYLALAEVLDAPLITKDGALATAPWHGAVVEVFD